MPLKNQNISLSFGHTVKRYNFVTPVTERGRDVAINEQSF